MNIYTSSRKLAVEPQHENGASVNARADKMQAAGYMTESERRGCWNLYELRKAVERAEQAFYAEQDARAADYTEDLANNRPM